MYIYIYTYIFIIYLCISGVGIYGVMLEDVQEVRWSGGGVEWKVTRTKFGRQAVSPPARRLKDQTAEEKTQKTRAPTKAQTKQPTYVQQLLLLLLLLHTIHRCCSRRLCRPRTTTYRRQARPKMANYRKQASQRRGRCSTSRVGPRTPGGWIPRKPTSFATKRSSQRPGDGYPESQQALP